MNPKVILFLLAAFCCRGFAQTFEYERYFGAFENATSFYINSAGVVFVTDDVTDEVFQLDTLGNLFNLVGRPDRRVWPRLPSARPVES